MAQPKPTSDLAIARAATLLDIRKVAARYDLDEDHLILHGNHMAKVNLSILDQISDRPQGKYIDVTAINPTPLGEGKTVTTIGLGQGLNHIGKKAVSTIRQPSMGPVFGIKGGAAGGGQSQVIPMEDFNLHLTGDTHAVGLANNLLAAWVDTSTLMGNPHRIDPQSVSWRRCLDVNDRTLRQMIVGLGGPKNGIPRETGFDITSASEVMAILGLSSDAKDLRTRLGRIVVGLNQDGDPVTAEQLGAAGAMAVVLKEAIHPTFMQTLEGTGCFVHTGPFANIAHGNSSIVADRIALKLCDYVVTESGFGADMGAEKFFNIKCRISGMKPDAAVVVATIRALKVHSGRYKVTPGKPLPEEILREDISAIEDGIGNLQRHIENVGKFGVPVVVALNRFPTDTDGEVEAVLDLAKSAGAFDAVISDVHTNGGAGGAALADAVVRACSEVTAEFKTLYPDEMSIKNKIGTICQEIYRADGVDFKPAARKAIKRFEKMGLDHLPICMAKTQYSFSDDPKKVGAPENFRMTVRDIRLSAGAGYLYALTGDIMTMPGLGSKPALLNIDLDEEGMPLGLF
ncbi:MAG: formate--tetrahydrofolate ligase [Planctomycetes bacterium]|nr:formate--tetrahydrofolate ligase [Planctomycetota bacterium]MBT6453551.1 formate--tetrahydrofolate ligase [Planctomycetota bacterium]MBT6539955.1 formate--tetrahydrofolate ligase [Planctomycetota bacterium]MBT6785083.1 formate--tetrahydrofolate ligase [Planctomycetota bacterium]MBT6968006.1 formate--tetrahydrofolate ligase [Planctomycetota bacterium]